jgi:uncharacterized linocin/CFP29 family protein
MPNKYLAREDAPFDAALWSKLDAAMIDAASRELTGRRLLEVEGPYGLGLKAIPRPDKTTESGLIASQPLPVLSIYEEFTLGTRDLANYEREGAALSLQPVVQAARRCAQREDALIFYGAPGIEAVDGLFNVPGAHSFELADWSEVGAAADDVIQAVTELDTAGFHGPYIMALAPERYNMLLRLYERGNKTELEHLQMMVTDGIVKAPALEEGGLLMATGRQFASLILGQDMTVGFLGPAGDHVEFFVSESLVLRIRVPEALCALT